MSKLAIEILNDYPLATETARDWFVKRMIESFEQDNAPEEFKNHMLSRGVPDITLAIMLDQSPRNFFDVLDDNKILRSIEDSVLKRYLISVFTILHNLHNLWK